VGNKSQEADNHNYQRWLRLNARYEREGKRIKKSKKTSAIIAAALALAGCSCRVAYYD
jgi:hypothetical protein